MDEANIARRERLIALVKAIIEDEFDSEPAYQRAIINFAREAKHPEAVDLMFASENLSPEEVVDKVLAYKPIDLDGASASE